MFILNHPTYPRTKWEKLFKYLYSGGVTVNFATFVVTMASFYQRLKSTYRAYWSATELELDPYLVQYLTGCNYSGRFKIHELAANSAMTVAAAPFAFLNMTTVLLVVLILHACLVVWLVAAQWLYARNIRHFRIGAWHVPVATLAVMLVVVFSFATVGLIAASRSSMKFLNAYVQHCAKVATTTDFVKFIEWEADSDVVFGLELEFILIAVCLNFAAYAAAFVKFGFSASDEHDAALLRVEFPWEGGVLCMPNKPRLTALAARRRAEREKFPAGPPPVAVARARTGSTHALAAGSIGAAEAVGAGRGLAEDYPSGLAPGSSAAGTVAAAGGGGGGRGPGAGASHPGVPLSPLRR